MKGSGQPPVPSDDAESRCISCGHCVAVCPTGAFSLETMPVDECIPLDRALWPLQEQLAHLMRSRRSIRRYEDRKVDSAVLKELIHTVSHAPSGHNVQDVEWLVVHDREKVTRLSEITIDWLKQLIADNHPIAERFGAKQLVAAWRAGIDPICRNAPHLIVTHAAKQSGAGQIDSMIALTWFELLASSAGLGTCWAGFVQICASFWPPLTTELDLPETNALTGAMMVGYPKYDFYRLPQRREKTILWR